MVPSVVTRKVVVLLGIYDGYLDIRHAQRSVSSLTRSLGPWAWSLLAKLMEVVNEIFSSSYVTAIKNVLVLELRLSWSSSQWSIDLEQEGATAADIQSTCGSVQKQCGYAQLPCSGARAMCYTWTSVHFSSLWSPAGTIYFFMCSSTSAGMVCSVHWKESEGFQQGKTVTCCF